MTKVENDFRAKSPYCRVKRVLIGCSIGPCARFMLEITPTRGYTTYHFSLDTTLLYPDQYNRKTLN